jgi:hypothetical protein
MCCTSYYCSGAPVFKEKVNSTRYDRGVTQDDQGKASNRQDILKRYSGGLEIPRSPYKLKQRELEGDSKSIFELGN